MRRWLGLSQVDVYISQQSRVVAALNNVSKLAVDTHTRLGVYERSVPTLLRVKKEMDRAAQAEAKKRAITDGSKTLAENGADAIREELMS